MQGETLDCEGVRHRGQGSVGPRDIMPSLGKRARETGDAEQGRAERNTKRLPSPATTSGTPPSPLSVARRVDETIYDHLLHGEEVTHDLRDRLVWGSKNEARGKNEAGEAAGNVGRTRLFRTPGKSDKRQEHSSKSQRLPDEDRGSGSGVSSALETLAAELVQESANRVREEEERFWCLSFFILLPLLVMWVIWLAQFPNDLLSSFWSSGWKTTTWIASGLPPLLIVNIVTRRTPSILSLVL